MTSNREYWLSQSGDTYRSQQDIRKAAGCEDYPAQEAWLYEFVSGLVHAKSPLRVLDYGVGFGRMAKILGGVDGIEYHGYDISQEMVKPLLRDPTTADVASRIRVGVDPLALYPSTRFDLIFTVSVLIHNSPQQAAEVLRGMAKLITPDGVICLIENKPVGLNIMTNLWHAGCWMHDFAYSAAKDFDVEIDSDRLPGHAIYLLRSPGQRGRVVRVRGGDGVSEISREQYLVMTQQTTQVAVQGLEAELQGMETDVSRLRDLRELHLSAVAKAEQFLGPGDATVAANAAPKPPGDSLGRLLLQAEALRAEAGQLRSVRVELDRVRAQLETYREASRRRERIRSALVKFDAPVLEHSQAPTKPDCSTSLGMDAIFEFDSNRDTRFSNTDDRFGKVLHVMHQGWLGIRAAAAALPGHKLAISSDSAPSESVVDEVIDLIRKHGINRVMLHGFSKAMGSWAKGISAADAARLYLAWHGAPAMWVHTEERNLFFEAQLLADKGVIRRFHIMRNGSEEVLGSSGWKPQLFNMPPNVAARVIPPLHDRDVVVLVPSWNLIHKNLATNVLAATLSERVRKVIVLAKDFALPARLHRKIEIAPKLDQAEIMGLMSTCDLIMNASIVDCQPMVELEALAVRTPCVRGRLNLEVLDKHPYAKLMQVDDALSVAAVKNVVDTVIQVNPVEARELMDDYSGLLIEQAADRLADFLEL